MSNEVEETEGATENREISESSTEENSLDFASSSCRFHLERSKDRPNVYEEIIDFANENTSFLPDFCRKFKKLADEVCDEDGIRTVDSNFIVRRRLDANTVRIQIQGAANLDPWFWSSFEVLKYGDSAAPGRLALYKKYKETVKEAKKRGFKWVHYEYASSFDKRGHLYLAFFLPQSENLSRLKELVINIEDFNQYRLSLLNKGWIGFTDEHFRTELGHPLILSDFDGAMNISPPSYNSSDLELGDILLKTAWAHNLTPRPFYMFSDHRTEKHPTLRFVKRPDKLMYRPSAPTTISTLEEALSVYPFPIKTFDDENPAGNPLGEVLELIKRRYSTFAFEIDPKLLTQRVALELEKNLSLPQILNHIALLLDLVWDWGEENVIHMAARLDFTSSPGCQWTRLEGTGRSVSGDYLHYLNNEIDTSYDTGNRDEDANFLYAKGLLISQGLHAFSQKYLSRYLNISVPPIEKLKILPFKYHSDLTLGEVLFKTAWAHGLTPRTDLIYDSDGNSIRRPLIKFVPMPHGFLDTISGLPTVEMLEKALHNYIKDFNTTDEDNPHGKPLAEVIEMLLVVYGDFSFKIDTKLLVRRVKVILDDMLTLSPLLDHITLAIDAVWDWGKDNTIYIMERRV